MEVASFTTKAFEVTQYNPRKETIVVLVKDVPGYFTGMKLSEKEFAKASSFRFENDRNAFAWRHHLLNLWLSDFTASDINGNNIELSKEGKPYLESTGFYFNISHSGEYLAFAFSDQPIGIDIETIKDRSSFDALIDEHFHLNEKKILADNPDDTLFISTWTRKEALLKAIGSGLTDELKMIDTTSTYYEAEKKRYLLNSWQGKDFVLSVACLSDTEIKICQYEVNKNLNHEILTRL